jgi:hypothetical protein
MAEDQAARTARLSKQWLPDMSTMRFDEILGEDGVSVKTAYRDLSEAAGDAAYAVAKADKVIMEKTAELVGSNVAQLEDLAEAQRQVASLMSSGLVSSFSALGKALVNGENGWEAWAKAGVNAIAGVLEQWAAATAAMGFAELFNPLTAASGAAKILAAAGAATAAGVMRGGAAASTAVVASPAQSVQIINVQGSVIAERRVAALGASATRQSSRGY